MRKSEHYNISLSNKNTNNWQSSKNTKYSLNLSRENSRQLSRINEKYMSIDFAIGNTLQCPTYPLKAVIII